VSAQIMTVLPEIAILIAACVVLVADLFVPPRRRNGCSYLRRG